LLALLLIGLPASAAKKLKEADFPPITPEQWALSEVPDEPNAPAVVIHNIGRWILREARQNQITTQFIVNTRVKILTEQGKDLAEYTIDHDEDDRLTSLKARTVLPGGKVIPVPEDSIFRRKSTARSFDSRRRSSFTSYETAIVFPAVEPGAILDFSYEIRYDYYYFTRPWAFQSYIPTLHSEVTYEIPKPYDVAFLPRITFNKELQHEVGTKTRFARNVRVWLDNVPAIPLENDAWPFEDLASSFDLLVTRDALSARLTLFEGWAGACQTWGDWALDDARRKDRAAKNRAVELIGGETDPRKQAEILYRFVQNDIETTRLAGLALPEKSAVDKVLEEGRGTFSEKALLLERMLLGVKLDAQLVWVRNRNRGLVNEKNTSPYQFSKMLVAVDLPEGKTFLDPTDDNLPFGRIHFDYEGTKALLYHTKDARLITLPSTPHEDSARQATLNLAIDDEGRVTGTGALHLTGHHAWLRVDWKDDEGERRKAWQAWIENSFPGYTVGDLKIEAAADKTSVDVGWSLEQADDAVLGDEVTVVPAAPLGPVDQPFTLPPSRRRTPVLLSFRDRDSVEMRLSWPEDWEVDVLPTYKELANAAGAVGVSIEVDEAARSLVYRRTFDVIETEFVGARAYNYLRKLYATAEKNDAQRLVLVLP
jgi:hypothetical protein